MTHLTREELQRWWAEGRPADRERIVGHLAECDACGTLYGEAIDVLPVAPGAVPAASPGLVARGYRAYRPGPRRTVSLWSRPAWIGYAAAAAVLAAVAVPLLRAPTTGPPPDSGGIRGTSLQPLEPIGTVAPPVRFRWASPVQAAGFVVEVRDDQGRLLFTLSSASEAVDLPAERLAGLALGRTYSWVVIARDPHGDEILRAPPRSFALAAASR